MRGPRLLSIVLMTGLLSTVATIGAAPGQAADAPDRAKVIADYQTLLEPLLGVPTGFTGNVAACDPGTISPQNADATLAAVNYMRRLAGLSPVALNPARSADAQAAALIMAANETLTHRPTKDSRCWTKSGYEGASHGNLALGWSSSGAAVPQSTGPRAVLGYMEDPGETNVFVGHRRWILWPGLKQIGTGDTDVSNTIVVIPEPFVAQRGKTWVSWPTAGAFPRELEPSGRWSLSYPKADFRRARVTMTTADGRAIDVKVNPIANGYADNTLSWEASLPADYRSAPDADYPVNVSVTGVRMPRGKVVSKSWTTTLVHASSGS